MESPIQFEPNRILVIDDNRAIHEDIHKILCASTEVSVDLQDDEGVLFGTAPAPVTKFQIDSAYQGEEGLEKVKQAQSAGQPYALAFVDIRMPPGWDGIETISRLRKVDPQLQTVILTAYSDYSWEDIQRRLGRSDSLFILKKPFENIELTQLSHTLSRKWLTNREAEARIANLDARLARLTFAGDQAGEGQAFRIRPAESDTELTPPDAAADFASGQNSSLPQPRKDRERLLVSLRVLSQMGKGLQPSRRDLIILRRYAGPDEASLPFDELCCRLLRRELEGGEHASVLSVARGEIERFQKVAGQVSELTRPKGRQHLTEAEYSYVIALLREGTSRVVHSMSGASLRLSI